MKFQFLAVLAISMLMNLANAQSNRALSIYEDGTNFFLAGLEENLVTNLTIEGWVKLDGAVTIDDYTALVDFRDATNNGSKALIFKNSDGPTISYEWNGNWTYLNGDNYVEPDVWQHVAIVISGDDMEARFYVNGMQTGADTDYSGLGDELPLGENMRVGAGLSTETFRTVLGVMDEIRIWTVARTEDELFENMDKEIDPTSEGLLMYYQCNEEDNSDMLVDATGNGYDLFNNGGTGYEFVDDTEWNTGASSVINAKNSIKISSFPNPVKDQLQFKGIDFQNAEITIRDLTGQIVNGNTLNSPVLNVSELNSGIYFFEIKQNASLYNGKFIKK